MTTEKSQSTGVNNLLTPVGLAVGMGTLCTSNCKSCFERNSLMREARGDVAECLRQTSRLMRCEEWFGHSSSSLPFVSHTPAEPFPHLLRLLNFHSVPQHHFHQAQQCFLPVLRIISLIYLILKPAKVLFWEEILI